jgi:putative oxidoreductase
LKPSAVRAARLGAGIVFVVFGIGKFVNHESELASFRTYGIPAAELAIYAVGALELLGGFALIADRAVRLAALVLAANMVVAIGVSGIGQGEVVPSLTLAPVLLAVLVALLLQRRRGTVVL